MRKPMTRTEVKCQIGGRNLSLFVFTAHVDRAFLNLAVSDANIRREDVERFESLLHCRAFFRPSKRQNTIGDIVFAEGDIGALIHELGHAAHDCVERGWVPDILCGRKKTDEERRCVALGMLAESVLAKVRHAIH